VSISANSSYPAIKADLRQGTRRAADLEQQAYAAVGRRFAGGEHLPARRRAMRVLLGAGASLAVLMLVVLLALLSYENINSPHARQVAASGKALAREAGPAPAAQRKPVLIIDEKDDAPARAPLVPAPLPPLPPLVMLSPAEAGAGSQSAPAALAPAAKALPRLHAHAHARTAGAAGAAGKHALMKAGKAAHAPARRKAAHPAPRTAPSPMKRKAPLASIGTPARHGAGTGDGALGPLLAYAGAQRRYLVQPLPSLAARARAPRRRYLGEP
jgi:hypothetical protein